MTQTLGSSAKVRWDRPKDRLNRAKTEADLKGILELIVEIRSSWDHAVEGSVYAFRAETNGRGKGFEEIDPTQAAAMAPTRQELRGAAIHAAIEIDEARDRLKAAAWTLHRALMRTDPAEWIHEVEKRQAVTQE